MACGMELTLSDRIAAYRTVRNVEVSADARPVFRNESQVCGFRLNNLDT